MAASTSLSRSLMWDCTDSSLLTGGSHGSKKPEKGFLYEQNPSRLWCRLSVEQPSFTREYDVSLLLQQMINSHTHNCVSADHLDTGTPPPNSTSQSLWESRRKRSLNWLLTHTHTHTCIAVSVGGFHWLVCYSSLMTEFIMACPWNFSVSLFFFNIVA